MITHFQTCIYVRPKSFDTNAQDIIYSIQKIVLSWICKKEARSQKLKNFDLPPNVLRKYFHKLDSYTFPKKNRPSTLKTACYLEGEGKGRVKAWAARYIHDDADSSNGRRWIIDIGLNRLEDSICVVYITVSHEKDKYFLGETQQSTLPDVSIPAIVKKLIANGSLEVALDKRFALPLGKSVYTVSKAKEGDLLFDWIDSYLRRYVVVVFNGKAIGRYAVDLHELVQGKAIVLSIDENPEMKDYMGTVNSDKEHLVPFNCFRVFFPAVKGEDHTNSNRIFKLDSAKYAVEQVGRSLLSNYMLNCHDGVGNIEKIGHLITLSKLRNHKEVWPKPQVALQNGGGESESEQKDRRISELEEELRGVWDEIAEEDASHKREIEEQKQESERHQKKVEKLTYQLEEVRRNSTTKEQTLLEWTQEKFPDNLKEMLLYAEKMMAPRLVVLKPALKSAEEASYKGSPSKAWEMLVALGAYLYDKKYVDGCISVVDFNNKNNCELSMTEGSMTKKDSELLKQRDVTYNGKNYDITPHVKIGTKPPKLLRLHFQFVEDEKKIIIGHFGDHLDNYTTKSIK